ncbi:hypothetical protein AXF42_Ash011578 [Apostasia shenzhenica]|uniref:Uncharacterized protein n=1 Tax=Apostasia shenzhenica TaxID=1088818 RepID=A0A2I0BB10_9ASPA|nr:hypothetical protein AXF42_Ash011578 [Apostasia shenzhenica]
MEALVFIRDHRNQGYSRRKLQKSDRFSSSSPSRGFSGIYCRTSELGSATDPCPPTVAPSFASFPDPRSTGFRSESSKASRKSNPIAICPKPLPQCSSFSEDHSCSELWAGPAYSNSPPPSSLPIPKFSLRQKRSISLDLPSSTSGIKVQIGAKSAPASPTRDSHSSSPDFSLSTASATENLRRILNLDLLN